MLIGFNPEMFWLNIRRQLKCGLLIAKQKLRSEQAVYWWARKHLTLSTPSADRLLGVSQSCASVSGELSVWEVRETMPSMFFFFSWKPCYSRDNEHVFPHLTSAGKPVNKGLFICWERQIVMPGSQESVATQREKTMCDQVACLLRRCKNVRDAVGQRRSLTRSQLSCEIRQASTKCLFW